MRAGVVYNLDDEEIWGIIQVSWDPDLELNYDPERHGLIEIQLDHHIFRAQEKWRVNKGKLKRIKP